MKKIVLIASMSILFIQCNKKNELPELAKDNDYETFDLRDRVCEINQTITLLENTNYNITDKNIKYTFNSLGYLINDSIYNDKNDLIEVNTYEKLTYPLSQKQFISKDNFITTETVYDSLKNIVQFSKKTQKGQVIEEQKNSFSDDYIIREDYFISGNNRPSKTIEITRNGDVIKNKVIYSETRKIVDSIVYVYDKHNPIKETHYNQNKEVTATLLFLYNENNLAAVKYLDKNGNDEAVEEFEYNSKKQLTYKYVFNKYDNSIYEEINVYNKNNKIEKSETKLNNVILTSTQYTYNPQGDLIQLEMNNFTNKENYLENISYVYDKKGNWISKEVEINNKPIYKTSRKISYCN